MSEPKAEEPKATRQPVNYLWSKLNWDFLKMLAEIAHYAEGKYGCAEQYTKSRLEGQDSPINHAFEHLRKYAAGEKHDKFGTLEHQLAAVAYNVMMEFFYQVRWGFKPNPVMAAMRAEGRTLADELREQIAKMAEITSEAELKALADELREQIASSAAVR